MKTITFRQLQTNTSWLKDLPVTVVRYGKPMVMVTGLTQSAQDEIYKVPDSSKIIQKKEKDPLKEAVNIITSPNPQVIEPLREIARSKGYWICSHGVPGKLCKKIACQKEARKHG